MKLAPRMIQSMEILQLPLMALEERIEQELAANPVLERKESEFDPGQDAGGVAGMPKEVVTPVAEAATAGPGEVEKQAISDREIEAYLQDQQDFSFMNRGSRARHSGDARCEDGCDGQHGGARGIVAGRVDPTMGYGGCERAHPEGGVGPDRLGQR